jgi:hypothetical protein
MRLLEVNNNGTFSLSTFLKPNIPPYAILSHTWGSDGEEITFEDIANGTGCNKTGFQKLCFCRNQAKIDGLHYFWVDTCCIDKSNSSELAETINSMFQWYHDAARCYVYLTDVSIHTQEDSLPHMEWESSFRNSRWFTRGWTLQELLAPNIVEFYSRDRVRLGDKLSLQQLIHKITGIAINALRGHSLQEFSVKERLEWANSRQTTREEDAAYCLLGIFEIFLPLLYGEGQTNAMNRLKRHIKDKELETSGSQHVGKYCITRYHTLQDI